jgi:hypothetical protein
MCGSGSTAGRRARDGVEAAVAAADHAPQPVRLARQHRRRRAPRRSPGVGPGVLDRSTGDRAARGAACAAPPVPLRKPRHRARPRRRRAARLDGELRAAVRRQARGSPAQHVSVLGLCAPQTPGHWRRQGAAPRPPGGRTRGGAPCRHGAPPARRRSGRCREGPAARPDDAGRGPPAVSPPRGRQALHGQVSVERVRPPRRAAELAPTRYLRWASETSARPLSCAKKMARCLGDRLNSWR